MLQPLVAARKNSAVHIDAVIKNTKKLVLQLVVYVYKFFSCHMVKYSLHFAEYAFTVYLQLKASAQSVTGLTPCIAAEVFCLIWYSHFCLPQQNF